MAVILPGCERATMRGVFGHPLGSPAAPQGPSSPYRIPTSEQCIGVGIANIDFTLNFPERHGEHNWLIVVHQQVPVEHLRAGAFAFRPYALAGIHAFCWVCERDYNDDIGEGPCLGDPYGRQILTRAEFRAMTDPEKAAWIESWGRRGPEA